MVFGGNKVLCFACSREVHKVANTEHYRVAIRLNPSQRSKTAKQLVTKELRRYCC